MAITKNGKRSHEIALEVLQRHVLRAPFDCSARPRPALARQRPPDREAAPSPLPAPRAPLHGGEGGRLNAFERAIAIITRAKQIRSDALAAELGIAADVVDAMLAPARADGRLVCLRRWSRAPANR
jgi:hypothetical protein